MSNEPAAMPGVVGRLLVEYEQTLSTNNLVREFGEAGEPEGIAVTAHRQTAGRGRRGSHWFTPESGSLCVSVLLRPRHWGGRMTLLPLLVALSAAEAVEALCPSVAVTLKWPNDLMVAGRKLGGVLCESFGRDRTLFVVAGLGLNGNFTAFDFPREIRKESVTLQDCVGGPVELQSLLECTLRRLDLNYEKAGRGHLDGLLENLRTRMPMLGGTVEIETGGRVLTGTAEALLGNGELAVHTPEGRRITVVSGHVRRYTESL